MTVTVVNPNRPFSDEQIEQMERAWREEVVVVEASVNFPLAEDGGMAETAYASAMGYPDISDVDYWYPTGLATGAAAVIATLHGRYHSRFPDIIVFGGPPNFPFYGGVSLNEVRNKARGTRFEDPQDPEPIKAATIVLNFSHNFTTEQKDEILELLGKSEGEVEFREGLGRQYQYESAFGLVKQVREQVANVRLSASAWQEYQIIINLPAHSGGAMIALADMHGRMGYFPTVLRVERADDGFHYTEAIDLEKLRLRALKQRQANTVIVDRSTLHELLAAAAPHAELGQMSAFRQLAKQSGYYSEDSAS